MEVQMPYTYTLTSVIPATPQQVYEAWLDSLAHSEMTGGEAEMSTEIGAEVSAWDGYITGSNLELVPGERIVQSWRTGEFDEEHENSIVTITLEPVEEGTLLTLVHSNVPDQHRSYEEGGWESQYFEPMRAYFARLEQEEAEEADESEGAEEREAAEEAPKSPAEIRRPAAKKAKKTAPRVKASAAKKKKLKKRAKGKAKSVATTKAKRKTAKPKPRKAARVLPRKTKAKSKSKTKSKSKYKYKARKRTRR
jgi:uncharacterized protein YndB with AHSA1/START domain